MVESGRERHRRLAGPGDQSAIDQRHGAVRDDADRATDRAAREVGDGAALGQADAAANACFASADEARVDDHAGRAGHADAVEPGDDARGLVGDATPRYQDTDARGRIASDGAAVDDRGVEDEAGHARRPGDRALVYQRVAAAGKGIGALRSRDGSRCHDGCPAVTSGCVGTRLVIVTIVESLSRICTLVS